MCARDLGAFWEVVNPNPRRLLRLRLGVGTRAGSLVACGGGEGARDGWVGGVGSGGALRVRGEVNHVEGSAVGKKGSLFSGCRLSRSSLRRMKVGHVLA